MTDQSASGYSQVDGPTDLNKTEQNRAHRCSSLNKGLKDGKCDRLTDFRNSSPSSVGFTA